MMKKAGMLVTLALVLASGEALAFGQTNALMNPGAESGQTIMQRQTVKEKLEERREEIQNRIMVRKEMLATRGAEARARLKERKRELIRNHYGRLNRRFQAAIARLEMIAERIESRLDLLADEGYAVEEQRAGVEKARSDIEVAKQLVSEAETEFGKAVDSETPIADFGAVKETMLNVKELLKDIHRQLTLIIQSIKKGLLTVVADEATEAAGTEIE